METSRSATVRWASKSRATGVGMSFLIRLGSMDVIIRPAALDDAEGVERLYRQSAAHLRSLGDRTDFRFSAEAYRRDGFGDRPAFSGIIAVVDGRPAGYLLYTQGYDTDGATRF